MEALFYGSSRISGHRNILRSARFVGAGPARERERSSRQDARELSNDSTISASGILPAGFAAFRLQGKLPQTSRFVEPF